MTSANVSSRPGPSVRPAKEPLGDVLLHRSVTAMLRRHIPASEVEDLAQTVLCDALAAESLPSDPDDVRRFVVGIARHKVADFHRRRRAFTRVESEELAEGPPPFEARAMLRSIAVSVGSSSHRDQETLEWLLREHAGERPGDHEAVNGASRAPR